MTDARSHYDDAFIRGLEWMWGEGFLSPGGPAEVAAVLGDTPVDGARVLDIGCGIGGVDVSLVADHGAARVTAVDIEAALLVRARELAVRRGLAGRIDFLRVEPGPLPFADGEFDLVFSKDSLIHVPDKAAVYAEMFRVLKPGGRLALGDWLGSGRPPGPEMLDWLAKVGLEFSLASLDEVAAIARDAGFEGIEAVDRNGWYAQEMEAELAAVSGDNYPRLVAAIGAEAAAARLASSRAKFRVVVGGELRPGHLRARRPR